MKIRCTRLHWSAALAVLALGLVFGSAATADESGSTLKQIHSSGTIRIGIANEVPFGYLGPNGELKGESAGTAKMVFKSMGIDNFDATITKFGGLIPGLKADRYDVVAAGMYVTPDRCKQVDFSIPNYSLGEGFLVKKGNPHNLHSFADIAKNPDLKITVVSGAIEDTYAQQAGIKQSQIRYVPDRPSAIADVLTGRSAAFAGTSLTVARLARLNPKAGVAKPFHNPTMSGHSTRGYGAFAFRKGDDALREEFNKHLKKVHQSKEWRDFMHSIGFSDEDLAAAQKVTVAQLCGGK